MSEPEPPPAVPPPPPPPMIINPPTKPQRTFDEESKPKMNQTALDRATLLQSIQQGKKLRKIQTNDRSSPIINNKPSSDQDNHNSAASLSGKGTEKLPKLTTGGLFANGFPKLKSPSLKAKSDINALTSKDTLERKQRSKSVQSSRPLDPPPPPPGSPLPPIPVKAPPPAAAAPTAPTATPPPQPPPAPSSLATLPTEKINLQKSGSSAGKSANKVETKKTSPQRRTSWMGGSSDVNRINDNFFDSNTQIEPVKPKSSSATIDILQSVKSGGSLKPTTYRGMKLDENGQMTKRVFNSFGPSSSHTVSKCNSDIEKVPQSSVKSNLTSKMDKPKQPAENISKGEPVTNLGSKGASDVDAIAQTKEKLDSSGNSVGKGQKKYSASDADDVIARANKKLSTFDFDK